MRTLETNELPVPRLFAGYLTEEQVAKERRRTRRTLRAERARGEGPPYIRLGKEILYQEDEFRAWLKSIAIRPVRGKAA